MPVRRQGTLLTGVAFLLGLCPVLGCRSAPPKQENHAAKPASEGSSHSWFSLRHSDPNYKSAQASAKATKPQKSEKDESLDTAANFGTVAILRPVAVRETSDTRSEISSPDPWRTASRNNLPAGTKIIQTRTPSDDFPPVVNTGSANE